MPVKDKSWIIILICAVIILLIGLHSNNVPRDPKEPTDFVGQAIHPLYPEFSTTINNFNAPNTITFTSIDTYKSLTLSINDDAVYNTAYVSTNGVAWQAITLSGTPLGGYWLKNNSTTTTNIPKTYIPQGIGTNNYIIIYTCTKITTGWDCHDNKWQIHNFTTIRNETCTPNCVGKTCGGNGCGGSCGTCSGTQTCSAQGQCVSNASGWQSGVVSWWKFNGDANDFMGVRNGVVSGATSVSSGCISGQCYSFDGVNDYIGVSYVSQYNIRDAITLSIWIKRMTGYNQTKDVMLLGRDPSWYFYDAYDSGLIRGDVFIDGVRSAGLYSNIIPFDNRWYNVVYTYDSSTGYAGMYQNGVLVSSTRLTGLSNYLIDSSTANFRDIGYQTLGRSMMLDEAMIWNRALSSTEVQQMYNSFQANYTCTPSCVGKTCGDNGCGGSCGTCTSTQTCNAQGQCIPSSSSGKIYYLSPSGNDQTGNGSINNPWFTLTKAWTVVQAGDTVYMRGGTYTYTSSQRLRGRSGIAGNLIKIWAYPGETPDITINGPTFNWGGWPAATIYYEGNYTHFKGIEMSNIPQFSATNAGYAFRSHDSSHNIFELFNIHDCGFALHLQGSSTDNLILNCDIYNIYDPYSTSTDSTTGLQVADPYEDGDGFSIGYDNAGTFNTFRGCRAWNIADDGWDLWRNDGVVLIENCWTWKCGYAEDGVSEGGNGQGFKFGISDTNGTNVLVTARNTVSAYNRQSGYHQNGMLHPVALYNNIAYANGAQGFWFGEWSTQPYSSTIKHVLTNNIDYKNYYKSYLTTGSVLTNNTFIISGNNTNYVVTDADFVSLDQSQLSRPRKADGSLPDITFLHLASGSDLIDRGTNVGLPYSGSYPDLGAFEYGPTACTPNCAGKNCGDNGCGGSCGTCSGTQTCNAQGQCIQNTPTGPTYYVSTTGSDSSTRDGSVNNPWRTLSYACSRVTTFGATIHVNPGNYIDNNRCDLAVGVNIEGDISSPPNITTSYTYGASTSYGYIRLDSPAGTPMNGNQTISYINLNGNSKTSYRAIAVNFRSNVKIHHCNFTYFRLSGVVFYGTASNWDVAPQNVLPVGNEVHDCSFISCANLHRSETNLWEPGHIRPQGQSEMKIYNNVFYQKDQAEGYNADIIAGYQNEGLKLFNNTFYKNDIEGEEWNFFYEMHYHRGGIEIYNNTFYGASTVDFSGTIKGKYDFGGKIYNNNFITNSIPPKNDRNQAYIDVESFTYVNDLYIYNNYFKYSRVGIHINNAKISMNNIWVYNNIIEGSGNSKDSYSNGILVESNWDDNTPTPIDNLHIYNNVITAANTNYAGILISAGGNITNLNIRNNIVGGSFNYPIRINDRAVTTRINGLNINNNIFYNTLSSNIAYSGGITYVNRNDSNNFPNVNPLFVGGSPYNFRLTSSSPARGKGINVGLDKDYAGNYWNTLPSIGAFEYR